LFSVVSTEEAFAIVYREV